MAAIFYYNPTGPAPLASAGSLSRSDWIFNGPTTDTAANALTAEWFVTLAGVQQKAHYMTTPSKTILWSKPASGPWRAPPFTNGVCLPLYTEVLSATNSFTQNSQITSTILGNIYGGTAIVPTN